MTDTLRDRLGACAHKQLKKQLVGEQVWYACECGQKFHVAPWDGRVSVAAAQPAPAVMGEDWPLVRAKDAATSFTIALPITEQMLREAMMGEERDTLIDHYYQDQGVTPEGELRPLVSKLLKRVERAEAALARTAAAESREEPDLRQALRKYIDEIRKDWPITDDMDHVYAHVASQTNAILDDLEERLAAAPQPGESQ